MPAGPYFEVMQKELIFLNLLGQNNNCSEVFVQIVFRIAENILKTYALKSVSTLKGLHHMRLRDYFTKFWEKYKKVDYSFGCSKLTLNIYTSEKNIKFSI